MAIRIRVLGRQPYANDRERQESTHCGHSRIGDRTVLVMLPPLWGAPAKAAGPALVRYRNATRCDLKVDLMRKRDFLALLVSAAFPLVPAEVTHMTVTRRASAATTPKTPAALARA
jgi:hypothetical protein